MYIPLSYLCIPFYLPVHNSQLTCTYLSTYLYIPLYLPVHTSPIHTSPVHTSLTCLNQISWLFMFHYRLTITQLIFGVTILVLQIVTTEINDVFKMEVLAFRKTSGDDYFVYLSDFVDQSGTGIWVGCLVCTCTYTYTSCSSALYIHSSSILYNLT